MNSIILAGLLCAFLQVVKGQNELCQARMVQECSNSLLSTSFNFTSLIIEKENIENTCDEIDRAKNCIEEYVDNCNPETTKEEYFAPAQPLFASCKLLREEYLPNLQCYRKFDKTYDSCLERIPEIVGNVVQVLETNSSEETVNTFCCSVNQIIGCVVFPTQQECGYKAGQTMQELLKRHLPPPLTEKCKNVCLTEDRGQGGSKTNTDPKTNPKDPKDPKGNTNSSPTIASAFSIWSTILSILVISKLG